jgi:hypothetical protein
VHIYPDNPDVLRPISSDYGGGRVNRGPSKIAEVRRAEDFGRTSQPLVFKERLVILRYNIPCVNWHKIPHVDDFKESGILC